MPLVYLTRMGQVNILIRTYNDANDYEALMKVIASEDEEWKDYLKDEYREALRKSLTYVAYADDVLCGYSRSLPDVTSYVWVIDLLVNESHRGHAIGRKLMECIFSDFPDREVYVLSDVDPYYEKLGYQREGSLYKVTR